MMWEWNDLSAFVLGPGRWIASMLSLITLGLWVISATVQWSKFGPRAQRVNIAITMLLFFLFIGFAEAWLTQGQPVFSIVGVAFSLVALGGALVYPDRPALVKPRVESLPQQQRRESRTEARSRA